MAVNGKRLLSPFRNRREKFSKHVDETLTLDDDLGELYKALYPARAKWYNIGLGLTSWPLLRVSDIDSINSKSSDPGVCLREMLSVYLKSGRASWYYIIGALSQITVGECQLAEQLLKKVPQYQENELSYSRGDTTLRHILQNMIVIGRRESGKSSLVNQLVGEKVAEEGEDVSMGTPRMERYQSSFGRSKVSVCDAPGLWQDDYALNDDEILEDIETGIGDGGNVFTYCVWMDQHDVRSEVKLIRKITKRFGTSMWEKGVFVLTFANKVSTADFKRKLTQFQRMLRNILIKDAKVPVRIANQVPVVPAGYDDSMLHGCDDWVARLKDSVMERATSGISNDQQSRVTTPPPEKPGVDQPPTGDSGSE